MKLSNFPDLMLKEPDRVSVLLFCLIISIIIVWKPGSNPIMVGPTEPGAKVGDVGGTKADVGLLETRPAAEGSSSTNSCLR